ncbi:MAG: phosphopentomutase [Bacillota bacterium]|nr:phosphopentomutase [Bacillota bacterium]
MFKRAVIIVLDSVGVGEAPDADVYGDEGSNTLLHVYQENDNFKLPNLEKIGITHIDGLEEIKNKEITPTGTYGRLEELSKGKDTTTGHWEISGLLLENPFPTYPDGFPKEVIDEFEKRTNRKTLGNKAASGTVIIEELGKKHIETGALIVYTSADSVFQIAAHEDVLSHEELYEVCEIARDILQGEHGVGRVIARPFVGEPGSFTRTDKRKDFSLEPISKTLLDYLKEDSKDVVAIGKIEDIFAGRGMTKAIHTKNNMDGIETTLKELNEDTEGLIFTNLVEFDMIYGHRNDFVGYGNALKEFDLKLPEIIENLKDDDLLIITADHGCDPTTKSTDHSREYVPIIFYGKGIKENNNLDTVKSFGSIAKTILDNFNIENDLNGESQLDKILIKDK